VNAVSARTQLQLRPTCLSVFQNVVQRLLRDAVQAGRQIYRQNFRYGFGLKRHFDSLSCRKLLAQLIESRYESQVFQDRRMQLVRDLSYGLCHFLHACLKITGSLDHFGLAQKRRHPVPQQIGDRLA